MTTEMIGMQLNPHGMSVFFVIGRPRYECGRRRGASLLAQIPKQERLLHVTIAPKEAVGMIVEKYKTKRSENKDMTLGMIIQFLVIVCQWGKPRNAWRNIKTKRR